MCTGGGDFFSHGAGYGFEICRQACFTDEGNALKDVAVCLPLSVPQAKLVQEQRALTNSQRSTRGQTGGSGWMG